MKASEFDKAISEVLGGLRPLEEIVEVEAEKSNLFKLGGNIAFHQPERMRMGKITLLGEGTYAGNTIYHPSVFLHRDGMWSKFDGTGMIVTGGMLFKFALCEHDWDESGANHSRGWHPRRCKKCGFDASIDSGD